MSYMILMTYTGHTNTPLMTGKAEQTYAAVDPRKAHSYDTVKVADLHQYKQGNLPLVLETAI